MKSESNLLEAQDLRECWDLVQPKPGGRGRKARIRGLIFGGLVVQEEAGRNKHGQALWRCSCECGQTKVTTAGALRSGHVTSCGCRLKAYRQAPKPKFGRAVVMATFRINGRYVDVTRLSCTATTKNETRHMLIQTMSQGRYRVPMSEIRALPSAAYQFTWDFTIRGLVGYEPMITTVWIEKGVVKGSPAWARCKFEVSFDPAEEIPGD